MPIIYLARSTGPKFGRVAAVGARAVRMLAATASRLEHQYDTILVVYHVKKGFPVM